MPKYQAKNKRDDHDHLTDGAGQLRLQVVDQDAHDDAQDRAGENRGGHHHSLLGVRQAEILGDLHAERAEHDPDHEGEIESKEMPRSSVGRCPAFQNELSIVFPSSRFRFARKTVPLSTRTG
jgi:hypothetical protein